MTTSLSAVQAVVPAAEDAPELHQALELAASSTEWMLEQQIAIARIPAPPFHEAERARYVEQLFRELALEEVHRDAVGNVLGLRPGRDDDSLILVSAHIDTVFSPGTEIHIRQEGSRWVGPGIGDNAAGVAALVTLIRAMQESRMATRTSILFAANVGEEGEGDLRGMKAIFSDENLSRRIRAVVVIDGSSTERLINQALGSRRFEVVVTGPGGHSWADFGLPNPIQALSRAVSRLVEVSLEDRPRSTLNIGEIAGGTSVNAIPATASMKIDIRSEAEDEIDRLESELRKAVAEALMEENAWARKKSAPLSSEIREIGRRPGGEVALSAKIIEVFRAVDDHLGIRTVFQRSSTDANVPISLGFEAVAIGSGGRSGASHSLQEWIEPVGREIALQRILLGVALLSGPVAEEAK